MIGLILFFAIAVAGIAYLVPWGSGLMRDAIERAGAGDLSVSLESASGNPLRGITVHNLQILQRSRMTITVPSALIRLDFLKSPREIVAILRDFEARFARKRTESWSLELPNRPVRLLMANGQFAYVWNNIPIKGTVNGEIRILPDKVSVRDLDLFAFSTKTITNGVYERGSGNYHYSVIIQGLTADTLTTLLAEDLPGLNDLRLGAVIDGVLELKRQAGFVTASGNLNTPRAFLHGMDWREVHATVSYTGGVLKLSEGTGKILGGIAEQISATLEFPKPTSNTRQDISPLVSEEIQSVRPGPYPGEQKTTFKVSGTFRDISVRDLSKLLGLAERADMTANVAGSFRLEGSLSDPVRSRGNGQLTIENAECNIPGENNPVRLKAVHIDWDYDANIFKVKRLVIVGADEDFYIAGQVLLDRGARNAVGRGVVIVRDAGTLKSLPDEVKRFFRSMRPPVSSSRTRKMALVRLKGIPRAPEVYFTPAPGTIIELTGETYEDRLQSVWRHFENTGLALF